MSDTNKWFFCRAHRPNATMRLFCLPYAGGGASMFNTWPRAFPETVELHAVQLPGRESRYHEPMLTDIYDTAKILADEIEPYLDRPYALFGYSMGALIAFELMRELRRRGAPSAVQLFVAARRAPQKPRICPALSNLPLDRFIEQMRDCYDPPQDAWDRPELLELILPALRADIGMCDEYVHSPESPFECPIHAFTGQSDRSTPPETVQAWRQQTRGEFNLVVLQGAHFFINTALANIHNAITSRLEQIMKQLPPGSVP